MDAAKITVAVRKRPLASDEIRAGETDIINVSPPDKLTLIEPKIRVDLTKYSEETQFVFDACFDEFSSNTQVYEGTAKPLIGHVFNKGKGTCFAYGQTGSGKTYTMMGAGDGLYVLAARDIFNLLSEPRYAHLSVCVSFYEIYNSNLYDVLADRAKLVARQDNKDRVIIMGLSEVGVTDEEEFLELIRRGNASRSTASTGANADSSRSHAILQITLRTQSGEPQGKLSFIDLAGSERGCDTADNLKTRRQEGAEINKSLLALKECIRALHQSKSHTPFRGSTLTRVLKDSFVGNSRTVMIANISPASLSAEHTLNTLRYADRVKEMKKSVNGPAFAASSSSSGSASVGLPPPSPRAFSKGATPSGTGRPMTADPNNMLYGGGPAGQKRPLTAPSSVSAGSSNRGRPPLVPVHSNQGGAASSALGGGGGGGLSGHSKAKPIFDDEGEDSDNSGSEYIAEVDLVGGHDEDEVVAVEDREEENLLDDFGDIENNGRFSNQNGDNLLGDVVFSPETTELLKRQSRIAALKSSPPSSNPTLKPTLSTMRLGQSRLPPPSLAHVGGPSSSTLITTANAVTANAAIISSSGNSSGNKGSSSSSSSSGASSGVVSSSSADWASLMRQAEANMIMMSGGGGGGGGAVKNEDANKDNLLDFSDDGESNEGYDGREDQASSRVVSASQPQANPSTSSRRGVIHQINLRPRASAVAKEAHSHQGMPLPLSSLSSSSSHLSPAALQAKPAVVISRAPRAAEDLLSGDATGTAATASYEGGYDNEDDRDGGDHVVSRRADVSPTHSYSLAIEVERMRVQLAAAENELARLRPLARQSQVQDVIIEKQSSRITHLEDDLDATKREVIALRDEMSELMSLLPTIVSALEQRELSASDRAASNSHGSSSYSSHNNAYPINSVYGMSGMPSPGAFISSSTYSH